MRLQIEDMNSLEKATLQNCRNCLLEDLDPTMSFLSQLYCARIITEDQKDRVEVNLYVIFTSGHLSYLHCLYLFACSDVQHICVVFLFCFSQSCVTYVACFSGLSFVDCPSVFSNVYLNISSCTGCFTISVGNNICYMYISTAPVVLPYMLYVYTIYPLSIVIISQDLLFFHNMRWIRDRFNVQCKKAFVHFYCTNTTDHNGSVHVYAFFFYPIFVILLLAEVNYCTYIIIDMIYVVQTKLFYHSLFVV